MRVLVQLAGRLGSGPCQVFSPDLAVEPGGHYACPDVTVASKPAERGEHRPAITSPTAVVEVLSPSTAGWDRGDKAEAYREIPSLQALVFVATDRRHLDAVVRDGDRWVIAEPGAEALYEGVDITSPHQTD